MQSVQIHSALCCNERKAKPWFPWQIFLNATRTILFVVIYQGSSWEKFGMCTAVHFKMYQMHQGCFGSGDWRLAKTKACP